ncbi:MAG: radical SAM protein [Deltaproteobacteria bacterium]|jgi:radical SAM protein with 4Fe4S-binding SPASM domain|nr:radical SAM protein [Deltaproteobacteria bacterium]
MDLFKQYFIPLLANQPAKDKNLAFAMDVTRRISLLSQLLRYNTNSESTLNTLTQLFILFGCHGDAYRAAKNTLYGEFKEATDVVNRFENQACPPLNLHMDIINDCSLRCPMCSLSGKANSPSEENVNLMTFPVFRYIWDKVKNNVQKLILNGPGEIFSHPNIYEILNFTKPITTSITTHGNVRIEPERIIDSSVEEIVFNLDGVDQRTYEQYRAKGDFNKVIQNIQMMVKSKNFYGRGPKVVIKYLIFKHNEAYIKDIQNLAIDLKVNELRLMPCPTPPAAGADLIRKFYPLGQHHGVNRVKYIDFENNTVGLMDDLDSPYCSLAYYIPNIKINGDVTLCPSASTAVGNILEDSLENIWESPRYKTLRLQALTNRYTVKDCLSCSATHNNFGKIFTGTILEYPLPPEPSPNNTLWIKDLKIEEDYLAQLSANGLNKEVEYFEKVNKELKADNLNLRYH